MDTDTGQNIFKVSEGYDVSFSGHDSGVSLKRFAHNFVKVCTLEVTGKLSKEDADQEILSLWDTFQKSRSGR